MRAVAPDADPSAPCTPASPARLVGTRRKHPLPRHPSDSHAAFNRVRSGARSTSSDTPATRGSGSCRESYAQRLLHPPSDQLGLSGWSTAAPTLTQAPEVLASSTTDAAACFCKPLLEPAGRRCGPHRRNRRATPLTCPERVAARVCARAADTSTLMRLLCVENVASRDRPKENTHVCQPTPPARSCSPSSGRCTPTQSLRRARANTAARYPFAHVCPDAGGDGSQLPTWSLMPSRLSGGARARPAPPRRSLWRARSRQQSSMPARAAAATSLRSPNRCRPTDFSSRSPTTTSSATAPGRAYCAPCQHSRRSPVTGRQTPSCVNCSVPVRCRGNRVASSEPVRELVELRLVQVESGLRHAAAPEVVLTSNRLRRLGDERGAVRPSLGPLKELRRGWAPAPLTHQPLRVRCAS